MNTAMASKTGRLFAYQYLFKTLRVDSTHIREPLSTPDVLALMWFFTRVSTDVNGQRTPLDEALAATWGHA